MLGAAPHAQAQKGGAFASTTTGTIKTVVQPTAGRSYAVRRWGMTIKPACNKRGKPHCPNW